jgi:hypothetical protein
LRHDVDRRALPRLDSREVGLAEIADRIPVLGVDDREQRVAGGGELPGERSAVTLPVVMIRPP